MAGVDDAGCKPELNDCVCCEESLVWLDEPCCVVEGAAVVVIPTKVLPGYWDKARICRYLMVVELDCVELLVAVDDDVVSRNSRCSRPHFGRNCTPLWFRRLVLIFARGCSWACRAGLCGMKYNLPFVFVRTGRFLCGIFLPCAVNGYGEVTLMVA
jgi:hypothetical protein